ncbi:MAG TPA: DUF1844 domain-containing protein [Candidatus Acidoferrales bacterium]|nr:DUF1844 domain-containing protein [Candidatus Acidoferrales bacterium]
MSESKDESFKVVDRRLFTETGEFRKDVAEQQEREQASTPAPKIDGAASVQNSTGAPAGTPNSKSANAAAQQIPAAEPPRPANRNFQLLVDFIARNAAMLLGGYQDPRTGQPLIDLEGAREIIDMMDALRETTRGNLGPEDERVLLDVIGSLKLSFMEVSKAAAAAMNAKAKAPR